MPLPHVIVRAVAALVVASLVGNASARPARAETGDARALMARVAAAYDRDVAGVLAVRSHSELVISAPLFHRRVAREAWFVFRDGTLAASSEAPDPRRPPLHDPYRTPYLGEYAYVYASCPACAPGTTAIAYESATRDVAHAHGTLVVDDATGRVRSGSETPYALPWPTRSGELTARWEDTAAGRFPQEIDGAFVGAIGPFVGHARYAQHLDGYGRYPSVEAATADLTRTTGFAAVAMTHDDGAARPDDR